MTANATLTANATATDARTVHAAFNRIRDRYNAVLVADLRAAAAVEPLPRFVAALNSLRRAGTLSLSSADRFLTDHARAGAIIEHGETLTHVHSTADVYS